MAIKKIEQEGRRLSAEEAMFKYNYQFQPFVHIYNRDNFLLKEIPNLHPDGTEYLTYWRKQVQRCIEGLWAKDGFGYRWMPGNLFFYVNLGTLLHKPEDAPKTAPRQKIRPYLRDVEWEFFYNWIECRGFSGFEDDDEYTCNKDVLKYEKGKLTDWEFNQLNLYCFRRNGDLKKYIPAREYLRKTHDKPLGLALFDNEAQNMFMLGSRGFGKDLIKGTKLYTEKHTINIEDVQIGDKIYGSNGKLTKVIKKYKFVDQEQFTFTLDDGRQITSGLGHKWKVYDAKTKEEKEVVTKEIVNNLTKGNRGDSRWFLPQPDSIEFNNKKDLKLDPYLLGALLGDGGFTQGISFTSKDQEVLNEVRNALPKGSILIARDKKKYQYAITGNGKDKSKGRNVNPVLEILKSYKLYKCKTINKFIPEVYKRSSKESRLSLVQGLMDTDGYCNKYGNMEFVTVSPQLSKDFIWILRSLGIKCSVRTKETGFSPAYRILIKTGKPLFRLTRKLKRINTTPSKYTLRGRNWSAIRSVESKGVQDSYCISVDNESKLFVANDFIVTHNSYMVAVGIVLHEWIFDGRKYFNKIPELYGNRKTENKVEIFVGAAQATKSADLLSKMKDAYDSLPGSWGEGDDYVPPPYFKSASGSLTPAAAKPWKHEYQEKEGGTWQTKGSGSVIKHGVYTTENPEAAAGTRPSVMVIEEVGLLPNLLTVHNSNEACVLVSGTRIGTCMYLGTGGNMEKIRESEIVFRDPKTYSFLEFDDVYEGKGKIGWFVPAFYNLDKFKDENGNTIYELAIPFYLDRRKEKRKGKSGQHAIDLELMNFPMTPSEMFLNKQGNILPIDELRKRQTQLEKDDLFEQIEKPVKLFFDSTAKHGIGYDIVTDLSLKPLNRFPSTTEADPEGCVVIYEFPLEYEGDVPKDLYIIGHDPYASDTEKGSNASIYVFKTGKYSLAGLGHNEIVAEYVGRPFAGRNKVNEILEKLAMFYNVGPGGIWFENDRGNTKEYFEKKNKLGLLCLKPMTVLSKTLQRRLSGGSVQYGYSMGSKQAKLQGIEYLRDWLLEERGEYNGVKLRNLDLIPSRALIQECIQFNMDDNFDRVMGACGFVIGLRNIENELIDEAHGKTKETVGSFFGNNKGLFLDRRTLHNKNRYR